MDTWKENLQQYLPDIEEFLTSVLLEETNIELPFAEGVGYDEALENMLESDIFLYTRDENLDADLIVILDKEWYGLLSSIMLGIEEKTKNDTTIELLEDFSTDLSDTVLEKMKSDGYEPEVAEIQVLSLEELKELHAHSEYFLAKMEIEGIADDKVRAGFLCGNPEALLAEEEPEEADDEEEKDGEQAEAKQEFSATDAEEMNQVGSKEEVISGRHIEFSEFDESPAIGENGDSHSMDLLKDVELDLSVELGRIELPLGKVLQLAKGSVIELEKLAGEPVDILVNGHQIAHGEVVVIDEHFGVRISNLVTTRKRLAGLQNGS
ncbi:flagellar motor switch protein FliN [Aliifodinibius sp. S!AR15-10]|uniref:flagellar motor switch protein FliN n=1 Tax=Aliifodinibius sp. S!AR15-10 TaxID=2950437 RepID=UPI002866088B|nr:flagellar motor switch protein FliN [Aliifodinibius sp. S!AR15-10]MDR8394244.1 flagellar motor switch protein FliN [Aliifodinibius sp. S!AR15-10]